MSSRPFLLRPSRSLGGGGSCSRAPYALVARGSTRRQAPCEREGDTRFQCSLERIPPEPEDTGGFEGYAGCIAVIKQVRTVLTIQKQIGKEQSTSLPLSDRCRNEGPSVLGKAEAFAQQSLAGLADFYASDAERSSERYVVFM